MSDRFQLLCIKYLDGSLSENEVEEFSQLVKSNPSYQKELAEILVENSAIRNVLGAENEMKDEVKVSGKAKPFKTSPKHSSRRFQAPKKASPWPIMLIAALVFLGIALPLVLYKKELDATKKNQSVNVAVSKILVKDIIGEVYKVHDNAKEKLIVGMSISAGDRIESSSHSFAKFETTKKSLVILNENSKFDWNEKNIDLKTGDIYAEISKDDIASVYHLIAPENNQIVITGTKFEWSYYSKINNAVLKVKEGKVEFNKGAEKKIVGLNQSIDTANFAKGPFAINPNSIAMWLQYLNPYKEKKVLLLDNFNSLEYSQDWTIKTTQKDYAYGPKLGLSCAGKDQKIELSSRIFDLGDNLPLTLRFAAKNIVGQNSFEYGYEIWSENEIIITQGFEITQVGLDNYKLRTIKNTQEPVDPGSVKSKNIKLPSIDFLFELKPSEIPNKGRTFYVDNNILPNVEKAVVSKSIRIVFYIKTVDEGSLALWQFKGIAVGYDHASVEKAFLEITSK